MIEADGRITLLGRGSVSINSGGEKIFPEEVEAAVKSHPAVFDCTVVGVPDARWGETVTAVVELRPGATATLEDVHATAGRRSLATRCRAGSHRRAHRPLPVGEARLRWAKQVATEE
jgi:acyl-CoA synthetase (AMP-forming)/AMP-acid ligase II